MYLLDTNVVSALRRPDMAPPALLTWAGSIEVADQYLSAITLLELEIGVRRIERRDPTQGEILRAWLDRRVVAQFRDRILAVDAAVAVRAAILHLPDPRPERDTLIAATALAHRLTLVTHNVRDFAPLGVDMIDPWSIP